MALPRIAEEQLGALLDQVQQQGKQSHNTAQEFPRAVRCFITIYKSGEYVYPDEVTRFALNRGWQADHAKSLGDLADAVYQTLKQTGQI